MKRVATAIAPVLLFCVTPWVAAQPNIQAVVSAASYTTNLAPGTWAAIFGAQLASGPASASSVPLPTTLNGVSVSVNGVAAPLSYVSQTQVNALIPFEAASLGPLQQISAPVILTTPDGTSATFNIKLFRNAPAIFAWNGTATGNAVAFDANFNPLASFDGGPIILYATGLGPTNPPVPSASGGAFTEPLNRTTDSVNVIIGEEPADVLFAGLAPGLPGVYQINALPKGPLTNRIYLAIYPLVSNIATLSVPAGLNISHVVGSIDGLYPASGAAAAASGGKSTSGPIGLPVMLFAGTFTTSFDIVPSAKPFQIVAQNRDHAIVPSRAIIDIDPSNNAWQATLTVPGIAERNWDFSATGVVVGPPFVNDQIPASLLDPIAVEAIRALPIPTTTPPPHSPNTTYVISGTLPTGGHFSMGSSAPSQVSNFGGFEFTSLQPGASLTATFELFVDGELIASKDVPYQE